MITLRRLFVASLALVFGAFNATMALVHLDQYNDSALTIGIGLFYLTGLALVTVATKNFNLPTWVAVIGTLVAVIVPLASHFELRDVGALDGYDTWYVTAVALILGAIAVRGQVTLAIVGGLIFAGEVVWIGGLDYLPRSGISGAIILIVACIAISRGLEKSAREIAEAQEIAAFESAAAQEEQIEAETHEFAKKSAVTATQSVLRRIASGKYFSREDREKYQLREVTLRDDISGGYLVNAKLKKTVATLRGRGVDVALLDDGGIETVEREYLDELIDIAISAISDINTGRVTIRTQPGEAWLIRVTASRPRVVTPDLDLKLGER